MKKEEKSIKSLGTEIQIVQIEKFIKDFDNAMKKKNKKMIKRIIFILGSFLLNIAGLIIFKNPILFSIGNSIVVGGIITMQTIDFKKENKKNVTKHREDLNNDSNFEERAKDIDRILKEGIGEKNNYDFYTEEYKQAVEKLQGKPIQNTPNLKVVVNDDEFLDKNETMIQIVREVDAYCIAYKLPPLTIKNKEWDCLFDTLYEKFIEKGIESKFYVSMSEIGRFVFAKILINNSKDIKIEDFINNINYLETIGINKEEIPAIQQKILLRTKGNKVVNFANYGARGDRRK
jgi:hypothetical protein